MKKKKKRDEKLQRKIDKKEQETSGKLNDMIAYVDEHGNISDKPPKEPTKNNKKKQGG
ncbi:MAG: cold-shock protein [Bacteroidota bacterium]